MTLICVAACVPMVARVGSQAEWMPSPNIDERRPNLVVIHHTSDASADDALKTLTSRERAVSSHYLIRKNGSLVQLVDERQRAWHAGVSSWGGINDVNSISIGIELDNNGEEPFPDAQIQALLALLAEIKDRYHISSANFVAHADVAPRRKNDPSRYFPWKQLAQNGFGLWCDPGKVQVPASFDSTMALQALGYDVSDLSAAVTAFKLHFLPDSPNRTIADRERSVLACLVHKRAEVIAAGQDNR